MAAALPKPPKFTRALVRPPTAALVAGLTAYPSKGPPDIALALRQHAEYVRVLREEAGLTVTELPPSDAFPDSCFVEDVAVFTPAFAMLTLPATPSREGEVDLIRDAVTRACAVSPSRPVYEILLPGTLEGGDVMAVGTHYIIGLSDRTNAEGAAQLIDRLELHGLTGECVDLSKVGDGKVLHLKTCVTYAEGGVFLAQDACGPALRSALRRLAAPPYHWVDLPASEHGAANTLTINGVALLPLGASAGTIRRLTSEGLRVVEVDISEFDKVDGGLTCLSLRF